MKMYWIAFAGLVCAIALCTTASGQDNGHTEQWGGSGISMRMTASGASIQFECAHGSITQPITPNAAGEFTATGSYTAERGGPVRKDEAPSDRPATYKGRISGDTMTLQVLLTDRSQEPLQFTLTRGKFVKVVKCR
jgi:hypothetical protein